MGTRRDGEDTVRKEVERIGRRVAAARAERRLTQEDVATLAGVPAARVSKLEIAAVAVRIDTLTKIAGAVGLRITLEPAA